MMPLMWFALSVASRIKVRFVVITCPAIESDTSFSMDITISRFKEFLLAMFMHSSVV
eukprot:CAMPEP_0180441682 /NCGR_PEP_ID=MMETSP1036_2-20121128/13752_1 /TAXON_ID=632150 /ORGANISM="Azadinium spinosum, Strain 3D9" /LENGTH=56 /DNA_ID=CAMNT_0022447905 /DNA_START=253 /DNA_END=423 /DNA_ORIENTATION=+